MLALLHCELNLHPVWRPSLTSIVPQSLLACANSMLRYQKKFSSCPTILASQKCLAKEYIYIYKIGSSGWRSSEEEEDGEVEEDKGEMGKGMRSWKRMRKRRRLSTCTYCIVYERFLFAAKKKTLSGKIRDFWRFAALAIKYPS